MKVFISWSGEKSRAVAVALQAWLPSLFQSVDPWMSAAGFDKETRWGADMPDLLEESAYAVICLTNENLSAPWTLFESGALYEALGPGSVSPYLLGLDAAQLAGPLAQFQATTSDEQGTLALARSINESLSQGRLGDTALAKSFARRWPELRVTLERIAGPPDDYELAREFFRRNRSELARKYAGQYVALVASKVIDHDEDFNALARRVFESGGVRPVFMPKLGREERTIKMPSPRVRVRQ